MGRAYIARVLLALTNVSAISALLCLNCNEVNNVEDCLTLKECASNQTCYSNLFIGSTGRPVYTLGCIDTVACPHSTGKRQNNPDTGFINEETKSSSDQKRSNSACLQCCNNANGCNKDLCGSSPSDNLRCMICRDVLDTRFCNKLTACGHDQFCFVQKTVNSISLASRYEMDCMGFQQCNALLKVSRQDCALCCNNTDFCNYDACDNWTATNGTLTTMSTAMTSQAHTTAVIPGTTSGSGSNTSAAQLILDGPNSSPYKSRVVLKCVSLPAADKFTWRYNHSVMLPTGVVIEKEIIISPLASEDKLIISVLDESKIGVYSCEAIISGRSIVKSHDLAITKEKPTAHIGKTFIPPYFALVCTTTGYPPPQIGWAFVQASSKSGAVDLPVDADVTRKGIASIVTVDHYKPDKHDGSWYCAATNNVGNVITEVDLP